MSIAQLTKALHKQQVLFDLLEEAQKLRDNTRIAVYSNDLKALRAEFQELGKSGFKIDETIKAITDILNK